MAVHEQIEGQVNGDGLACPTDGTSLTKEPQEITIERGRAAWRRVHSGSHWEDWLAIGHAHVALREEAMQVAHAQQAVGRRYNEAFTTILNEHGFAGMDKGDRARLFNCMEHQEEIQNWRATLGATKRQQLNHPSTVWRTFERATKVPQQENALAGERLSAQSKLKQEIVRLSEENERLRESSGDLWNPNDSEADIVRVLFEQLRTTMPGKKGESIAKKLVKAFAELRTETRSSEPKPAAASPSNLLSGDSHRHAGQYQVENVEA